MTSHSKRGTSATSRCREGMATTSHIRARDARDGPSAIDGRRACPAGRYGMATTSHSSRWDGGSYSVAEMGRSLRPAGRKGTSFDIFVTVSHSGGRAAQHFRWHGTSVLSRGSVTTCEWDEQGVPLNNHLECILQIFFGTAFH